MWNKKKCRMALTSMLTVFSIVLCQALPAMAEETERPEAVTLPILAEDESTTVSAAAGPSQVTASMVLPEDVTEDVHLYVVLSTPTADYDSEGYGPESEDYVLGEGWGMYLKSAVKAFQAQAAEGVEINSGEVEDYFYVFRAMIMTQSEEILEGATDYTVILEDDKLLDKLAGGEWELEIMSQNYHTNSWTLEETTIEYPGQEEIRSLAEEEPAAEADEIDIMAQKDEETAVDVSNDTDAETAVDALTDTGAEMDADISLTTTTPSETANAVTVSFSADCYDFVLALLPVNWQMTEVAEATETTEVTETTEATEATEVTETTETAETTEATEATEVTESTEATEVTETTEATEVTEASEATEATEATETTEASEATETTEATEAAETTEASEATEITKTTETTEATEATATEVTDETEEPLAVATETDTSEIKDTESKATETQDTEEETETEDKAKKADSASTGDSNQLLIYTLTGILVVLLLAVLLIIKNRKKQ